MAKVDVKEIKDDLYELLGLSSKDAASIGEKSLVKAYRKRALVCHPDKNPDNPKAAEQFQALSRALEILSDPAARGAYDRIRAAKRKAVARTATMDSKRRKLKEELEEKERRHASSRTGRGTPDNSTNGAADEVAAAAAFAREVNRLQAEGSRLLQQEREAMTEQLRRERAAAAGGWKAKRAMCQKFVGVNPETDGEKFNGVGGGDNQQPAAATSINVNNSNGTNANNNPTSIKVKWQGIPNIQKCDISERFAKYGKILTIIISVSKKKPQNGSALVEFEHLASATEAVNEYASDGNANDDKFIVSLMALPNGADDSDVIACSNEPQDSFDNTTSGDNDNCDITGYPHSKFDDYQSGISGSTEPNPSPAETKPSLFPTFPGGSYSSFDPAPATNVAGFSSSYSSFPSAASLFQPHGVKINPDIAGSDVGYSDRDFESVTLMKLRREEERKRLIEEMAKEDEDN